jgi:hypothetical protein
MSEKLIGNGAKFICLKWISVFYSISEPSSCVCANTLGWNKPHSQSHLILSLSIINPHGVYIIQHKADKLKKNNNNNLKSYPPIDLKPIVSLSSAELVFKDILTTRNVSLI